MRYVLMLSELLEWDSKQKFIKKKKAFNFKIVNLWNWLLSDPKVLKGDLLTLLIGGSFFLWDISNV